MIGRIKCSDTLRHRRNPNRGPAFRLSRVRTARTQQTMLGRNAPAARTSRPQYLRRRGYIMVLRFQMQILPSDQIPFAKLLLHKRHSSRTGLIKKKLILKKNYLQIDSRKWLQGQMTQARRFRWGHLQP